MKTITASSSMLTDCSSSPPLLFIPLALACFALSPQAGATCREGCLGDRNTVVGTNALESDSSGKANTAMGWNALRKNTADSNTATGAEALRLNTLGHDNTAVGRDALKRNGSGSWNTALGSGALQSNDTTQNTAVGFEAAANNVSGFSLCAFGYRALYSNTEGIVNTAFGEAALYSNTTGEDNDAMGYIALYNNRTGANNDAIGAFALYSNVSGSNNVAIGHSAGLFITGDDNVCIGANVLGVDGENNVTRVKNVGNTPQDTGIYVTLDAVGGTKLGYVNQSSSRRFKENIRAMDNASEAIFSLKPVNFRYKKEIDSNQTARFGLVAEDVEKVNPDLVARNERGELTTVRYEAVNAMLLNEFLQEHKTVQEQGATIAELRQEIAGLAAKVKEQAAQMEKVSARVEISRPSRPRAVDNH